MWRIMQISEDVIHHDLHNSLHPTQPHSIFVRRLKINSQAVVPGKEVDRWHIFLKTRLLRQHIIESRLTNMVSASWLWRISRGKEKYFEWIIIWIMTWLTNYSLILERNLSVNLWFYKWNYKLRLLLTFRVSQSQEGVKVLKCYE